MPIPKIFFSYWEGNQLSKIHYYSILSFLKHNKNEKLIIYTSEIVSDVFVNWNTPEHKIKINNTITLNDIINIDNNRISLVKINFEEEYNIKNNISLIYKADFIRLVKLYEHGGCWIDFDVFFVKPIPESLFNNKDLNYFTYDNTIPTGLLMCSPKNKYVSSILQHAKYIILNNNFKSNYQSIGPRLWEIYLQFIGSSNECECLDNDMVYPYGWQNYVDFFFTNNDLIKEKTFAVHWYNGAEFSKKYINLFNEKNEIIDKPNCVFEKYLIQLLNI